MQSKSDILPAMAVAGRVTFNGSNTHNLRLIIKEYVRWSKDGRKLRRNFGQRQSRRQRNWAGLLGSTLGSKNINPGLSHKHQEAFLEFSFLIIEYSRFGFFRKVYDPQTQRISWCTQVSFAFCAVPSFSLLIILETQLTKPQITQEVWRSKYCEVPA